MPDFLYQMVDVCSFVRMPLYAFLVLLWWLPAGACVFMRFTGAGAFGFITSRSWSPFPNDEEDDFLLARFDPTSAYRWMNDNSDSCGHEMN